MIVNVPLLYIPPPESSVKLLEIILSVIVNVPLLYIPPPESSAELLEIIQLFIIRLPPEISIPFPESGRLWVMVKPSRVVPSEQLLQVTVAESSSPMMEAK